MKTHLPSRGRHSPPFLIIGLVVVLVILFVNYWNASTQLQETSTQLEALQLKYRELAAQKQQLESTNGVLESKMKKSEEIYEGIRQAQDKKEDELVVANEKNDQLKKEFDQLKKDDASKLSSTEEKLAKATSNLTQLLTLHQQDEDLVRSLREENTKLSAQLSAIPAVKEGPESKADCHAACLSFVETAQEKLFKKIQEKYGEDALQVMRESDVAVAKEEAKKVEAPAQMGKLAKDILVVDRSGKVQSGDEQSANMIGQSLVPQALSDSAPVTKTPEVVVGKSSNEENVIAAPPALPAQRAGLAGAAADAANAAAAAPAPPVGSIPVKDDLNPPVDDAGDDIVDGEGGGMEAAALPAKPVPTRNGIDQLNKNLQALDNSEDKKF